MASRKREAMVCPARTGSAIARRPLRLGDREGTDDVIGTAALAELADARQQVILHLAQPRMTRIERAGPAPHPEAGHQFRGSVFPRRP